MPDADYDLLRELVQACNDFDATINFWMSDEAWDALEDVRRLCNVIDAQAALEATRRG